MKKISLFLWMLFLPLVVFAQEAATEHADIKLLDPLGAEGSISEIIARLIRAILGVSGSIALLMFVWGGFLWLTSAGETKRVTQGKETLKWASLGLVVILFAYTMVQVVIAALTSGTVLGNL